MRLCSLLIFLTVLTACSPVRPPAKAVPPETLKVRPDLIKPSADAPAPAAKPDQSK